MAARITKGDDIQNSEHGASAHTQKSEQMDGKNSDYIELWRSKYIVPVACKTSTLNS